MSRVRIPYWADCRSAVGDAAGAGQRGGCSS